MGKKEEVRLRKIPLGVFLDTLLELYNEGLDYIDIVGVPDSKQDTIGIMFSRDYMSDGMKERYEDFENKVIEELDNEERSKDIDLTNDDDLNQII